MVSRALYAAKRSLRELQQCTYMHMCGVVNTESNTIYWQRAEQKEEGEPWTGEMDAQTEQGADGGH